MTRRSSPRPTFDGPALIRHQDATLPPWGDDEAGHVGDRIFVSSDKIHQLEITLGPGQGFTHSPDNRTIFAADEVFYVLEGELTLANPQTGEVVRALAGEAVMFRRDTWHHGFNQGTERLRVLEYFSPPPSQGTSSGYAKTKDYLESSSYVNDDLLGRWPMERAAIEAESSFTMIRDADLLWRLEDPEARMRVGLLATTEHLTVGTILLSPGQAGAVEEHRGDECLYVLDGVVNVFLPEAAGQSWFELHPGDGFYLPEGTPHAYHNQTGAPATVLFGVAPDYLPAARSA
jgi:quercetin dioxygenase-like cupin family protein